MEIHSRLNREIDYSPWVFGPMVLVALRRIVASSFALDHHIVRRFAVGALGSQTERLINPAFNFLILRIGITGSPLSALNESTLTLEDGQVGRRYIDECPINCISSALSTVAPLPIPLVHLKGRPLDVIVKNKSNTNLDFIEIVFRGIRY